MPPDPAILPAPGPAPAAAPAASGAGALPRSIPADWRMPLAMLAAAAAMLMLATASSWGEMLHQWWNIDTYNHLLLVPPIMAWLVMLRADDLAAIAPRPFAPALVLVAGALALWWAGRVHDINLIAHAGAVGAVLALVPAMLGLRAAALLALPLGMGAFLVPFGDEIIPPLQLITADIAIALTHWSGIPAEIDGIYIDTPAGLFIVAEACSGVKFLIAMVALGVLVAFTRFVSWRRRAVFLAACIIVPILANGVRAWATIYVAQFIGAELATGFDHIVYGWIFFAVVVAALLAGAWRYFERDPEDHGWSAAAISQWGWLAPTEARTTPPLGAALAVAAMAAIAALGAML
jgi:exosortase A